MRNVFLRLLLILGLTSALGMGAVVNEQWLQSLYHMKFQPADLAAGGEKLENPDCGWYEMFGYELSDNGSLLSLIASHIRSADTSNALVLLQVNLKAYASGDISAAALGQLDDILRLWEEEGYHLILRFVYDWEGRGLATEPGERSIIERHMQQVAGVVNAHKDSVYVVQGVCIGNNGEMNASKYMDPEDLRSLMNTYATALDPEIFLAARTPEHIRIIRKSETPLSQEDAGHETMDARLGLFDDGMLGSETDLGTYGDADYPLDAEFAGKKSRQQELAYINQLCRYVPCGGECVYDTPYSDGAAAIETLNTMHVSYLNQMYDPTVLAKWKRTAYNGGEAGFAGKSVYDYIGTHLGYRYVVTDVTAAHELLGASDTTVTMHVTNVGFAPAYRRYDSALVLYNEAGDVVLEQPVEVDNRSWQPGEEISLEMHLQPGSLERGRYLLYFQQQDGGSKQWISYGNGTTTDHPGVYLGTMELKD
ncbi:MAG: DUF4832 domain-containing protein [Lachnospiraceae bacterium]|nr:DUF4832 domain-containing protein [Lachnospiraceae bacterium]